MALYDRDDPRAERFVALHNALQDSVTAKMDTEDKASDPLAFYWRRGVRSVRDRFSLPLNFRIAPPLDTADECGQRT